jgi:hypothetical protein
MRVAGGADPPVGLEHAVPIALSVRARCGGDGPALGIAHRTIASWQIRKAGLTQDKAQCGAVALIQRFGSALTIPPL